MSFDYNSITSLSEEEFRKRTKPIGELRVDENYRLSSPEELQKVERLLDVREGTLGGLQIFVGRASCTYCDQQLGINDIVRTGLNDAGHSKSAVLHTFLGNKYIIQPSRPVRCTQCNVYHPAPFSYDNYFYSWEDDALAGGTNTPTVAHQ